jgi:hypothetical protein
MIVKRVVFFAPLLSALLALGACSVGTVAESAVEEPAWVGLHPEEYRATLLKVRHEADPILSLYRDDLSRDEVVSFFGAIVHSPELAAIVLAQADEFDVAPSLAFALSWEESRFEIKAVNKNSASVDRGLFQLNSKSFPELKEKDFFDPQVNARFGVAHLRWCLDYAGSEVAGLAMYNAGSNRVKTGGTPKKTLDYVSRIQSFRDGIESMFAKDLAVRWVIADGEVRSAAPRQDTPRLSSARFPILNVLR